MFWYIFTLHIKTSRKNLHFFLLCYDVGRIRGSRNVDNIVFQNIKMENVKNPIIIDQNYCDQETPWKEQVNPNHQFKLNHKPSFVCLQHNYSPSYGLQNSAVQIRNIVYRNITGMSATKMTTIFKCSKTLPCQGIMLKDINLV